jgi:predicted membrane-bound mannosyltransferase
MTYLKTLTERITIAHALLGLILLAAGLMRLVNLGKLPLSPAEAEAALAVWQFWQAGEATITPTSPAYFLLTLLITPVLGFSDATVRLIPALAGLGLVALPWLLRRQIGTIAALTGSLLLAVSPLATITARTAGGDALALLALLLLVVGLVRYSETEECWLALPHPASAWLGPNQRFPVLHRPAGPGVRRRPGPTGRNSTSRQPDANPENNDKNLRSSAFIRVPLHFRAAAFPRSGEWLFALSARPGAKAQLLATWLGQFNLSGSLESLFVPLMALVRYELPLIVLGLVAMLWLIWQERPLASYATYWLMGLLVLLLLQRGELSNVPVLLLPGYLLVGTLVGPVVSDRYYQYSVIGMG